MLSILCPGIRLVKRREMVVGVDIPVNTFIVGIQIGVVAVEVLYTTVGSVAAILVALIVISKAEVQRHSHPVE